MNWNELIEYASTLSAAEKTLPVIAVLENPDPDDVQQYVLRVEKLQHFYMSPTLILQRPVGAR